MDDDQQHCTHLLKLVCSSLLLTKIVERSSESEVHTPRNAARTYTRSRYSLAHSRSTSRIATSRPLLQNPLFNFRSTVTVLSTCQAQHPLYQPGTNICHFSEKVAKEQSPRSGGSATERHEPTHTFHFFPESDCSSSTDPGHEDCQVVQETPLVGSET